MGELLSHDLSVGVLCFVSKCSFFAMDPVLFCYVILTVGGLSLMKILSIMAHLVIFQPVTHLFAETISTGDLKSFVFLFGDLPPSVLTRKFCEFAFAIGLPNLNLPPNGGKGSTYNNALHVHEILRTFVH
jgi:hypothetical protein